MGRQLLERYPGFEGTIRDHEVSLARLPHPPGFSIYGNLPALFVMSNLTSIRRYS